MTDTGATSGRERARLRLLSTTDLHMHIYPYDYYADSPSDRMGLARTASLIAKARHEAANCLLFDNGDFLQGNPMGDVVADGWVLGQARPHPMIAAMNWLGYDAATLGNHEFDYGLPFLSEVLRGADFPLVSANLRPAPRAKSGESLFRHLRPWALLDRDILLENGRRAPIRIGVTGVLPAQIRHWARAHIEGQLVARDMVRSAQSAARALRARGADLVILLAHCGLGPQNPQPGMENAAMAMAALPEVDALIAGHVHLTYSHAPPGLVQGKPLVMPGFWGSHLGIIDLDLELGPRGWLLQQSAAHLRPIAVQTTALRVDPVINSQSEVLSLTYPEHKATLAHIRRPVGHTPIPLNSFFAVVTESPATRLVAEAKAAHLRSALRHGPWAALPLLSAVAPFKAGGRGGPAYYTNIPPGDLAMRHLADLYLYPNSIRGVCVTGAELAEWLEHAAGLFNRIQPGQADQPLTDPEFAGYNFDTICGLTYSIDLSQPRRYNLAGELQCPDARRILDLSFAGRPVDPTERFLVATNSYRAAGGGGFSVLREARRTVFESHDSIRDILVRHVLCHPGIRPLDQPVWRFCPMPPGTSVLFDSAHQALHHLDEVRHLDVAPLGITPQSFARFRLNL